ncbi:hypothetical protein CPB83DRAFT_840924 [Crepidotus variabilis]|uniref:Uncharacterized protein n=1 Tax=Crepidotus variabilis TaxID=179855 RepID=A0A9P6E3K6_9AGAR|nr:hypothetical protein CPB83DRAFT_840924 [Crepidotus variabilis]
MKYTISTTSLVLLNLLVGLGVSGVFGAPLPNPNPNSSLALSTPPNLQRRQYIESLIEDILERRAIKNGGGGKPKPQIPVKPSPPPPKGPARGPRAGEVPGAPIYNVDRIPPPPKGPSVDPKPVRGYY